ncbi:MAG: family 78 glycoside hydrolase catalytic domain [Bryobacteraceae bacterium]
MGLRVAPLLLLCLASPIHAQQAPTGLRTEHLANPVGIDVTSPRFSWVLEHAERGQKQIAYQVLVSQSPEVKAGEVWDSGRIESDRSVLVTYMGKPLASGQRYFWKVRYWDAANKPSPYSAAAFFEMGLLTPEEWKGKWIGGASQLRKEFVLKTRPARARAYVSGLGYYELRINGRKVGDHVLDPGWTTYVRRVLYATYDVTEFLKEGPNVVAAVLGQGWHDSRTLMLQMNIDEQGAKTRTEVVSDATWQAHPGPIVSDSVYHGETYDARLETPGWDMPGYKDAAWKPAVVVPDPPKGQMSAQMMPPIRVVDTITPLKMTSPRPGMYVYDMGQNFSGWVELRVQGPCGAAVRLRHAELLYEDGTLNTENLRAAKATDTYILRGDSEDEVWSPRFTYHGFRYVEVTGYPGTPKPGAILGKVVHTDVAPVGGFSSSKPVLNQIQRLVQWSIRTNLHSIPTDCNQRDERMGWLADAHLAAEAAIWNYDMAAFYTNFLRDIHDIQLTDGTVPDTVPYRNGRRPADPAWGAGYPLLAWYMYVYYGDNRILAQHYEGLKAWADYLTSRAKDGVVSYYSYADWVSLAKTPGDLVSTAFYLWSVDVVTRAAMILGKADDAVTYQKLGASIRESFHRTFFNPYTGTYASGSQTALVLPLFLDVVPESIRSAAFSDLTGDIVYVNNTHLTTGILGTKYLLPLLTRYGRSDLAYDLATETSYPSWGYMVENGATTMWELWQNRTGPSMNSHNHPMFGSVGGWFYSALAGINPDPVAPGFQRIRIEPQVVRDLGWASGSVETPRGTVASSWSRSGSALKLEVAIPVGSEAEIHIPKLGLGTVTILESGKPVWAKDAFQAGVPGITGARQTERTIVIQAGSGRYVFEMQ